MIYLVTITLYELSVTNYFVLTHLVANSSLTPILFLNAIVIEIPLMAVHFSYLFTLYVLENHLVPFQCHQKLNNTN